MAADLSDKKILISSGPTRADIDAVRYITNRSSGRLGARIATEALALGAHVVLVAGAGSAIPQRGDLSDEEWERLRVVEIETVTDLLQTLQDELAARPLCDAVVHAMAVLDYVPAQPEEGKIRSGKDTLTLRLQRTPKVIRQIKVWSPRSYLVGFKLEVNKDEERLREIATSLLRDSRADLVVANDIARIRDEQHPAILVGRSGNVLARPQTKSEIAREVCGTIAHALG